MKKLLFISAFLLMGKFCFSQEINSSSPTIDAVPTRSVEVQDENKVYNTEGLDIKPDFPGGMSLFYRYVTINFKMPKSKNFKGGKVISVFILEKDGSITDVRIMKHPGFDTDKETIRVLSECPKWKPGVLNGKNVRTLYTLPINLGSN